MTYAPGVVIVGAGHAGFAAASSLRDAGYGGSITLLNSEPGLPYQRPPLSKGYLLGKVERARLAFRPEDFYSRRRIALQAGETVAEIDRTERTVVLASGTQLAFETLVLATGAVPRLLSVPGFDPERVLTLRTVADVESMRPRLGETRTIAIVGGGFIGLEMAAVTAALGIDTTLIESGSRVLRRSVSAPTAEYLAKVHRGWGTNIMTDARVERLIARDKSGGLGVGLAGGQEVWADLVVAGVGATPEVRVASGAGLAVDDGILVDRFLRTSAPGIYAIGDCARFTGADGASTVRRESVQNATDQARAVARTIAGDPCPYESAPWFWSDQRDVKLQIAGDITGYDRTEIVGDPLTRSFSTYCYRSGSLVGVESINSPTDHVAARKLFGPSTASVTRHNALAEGRSPTSTVELRPTLSSL